MIPDFHHDAKSKEVDWLRSQRKLIIEDGAWREARRTLNSRKTPKQLCLIGSCQKEAGRSNASN